MVGKEQIAIDVAMPAEEKFSHITVSGHTVFAYVIEGNGYFDDGRDPCSFETEGGRHLDPSEDCAIGPENVVLYGDRDSVEIIAGEKGVRFLLISRKPIVEPVTWYGPIVMNTQEELKTAFEEYRRGTFIKDS
jgi:quercetin 2,3-dioxygenase